MENYNYKSLEKKYNQIALKFLEQMNKKHKIICVLLTGSYYAKKLSKKSDLDMFIITNNKSNLSEKGVKIINGIKLSYFLNPYWKVIKLLDSEKNKLKRPTAEIIHFSYPLFKEKKLRVIKKRAIKTINSLIPKIDNKEKFYLGWKIHDKIEVFKRKNYDLLNKEYLKFDLFDLSVDTFFLIKRFYRPHAKYTLKKIKIIDLLFYKKIEKFLRDKSDSNLIGLASYIVRLLNFKQKDYFKNTKSSN